MRGARDTARMDPTTEGAPPTAPEAGSMRRRSGGRAGHERSRLPIQRPWAQPRLHFGPTAVISDDEVLAWANDSVYGLGAYLHTRDSSRIQRFVNELESGTVVANGMGGISPATPFGGYKQSGFGREGGRAGIDEMVRRKTVFVAP